MRGRVDGNKTLAWRLGERNRHVFDLQREVMNTLAASGQKFADVRLVVEWFQELDRHLAAAEESDPNIWMGLFTAILQAKANLEMIAGFVDRTNRPSQMVERGHVTRSAR